MDTDKNHENRLIEFICRNFMVEPDEINLEESLVDQGIIDSLGLVEISAFIEREFGLQVAETEMNRANFGSIKKMTAFLERREAR